MITHYGLSKKILSSIERLVGLIYRQSIKDNYKNECDCLWQPKDDLIEDRPSDSEQLIFAPFVVSKRVR